MSATKLFLQVDVFNPTAYPLEASPNGTDQRVDEKHLYLVVNAFIQVVHPDEKNKADYTNLLNYLKDFKAEEVDYLERYCAEEFGEDQVQIDAFGRTLQDVPLPENFEIKIKIEDLPEKLRKIGDASDPNFRLIANNANELRSTITAWMVINNNRIPIPYENGVWDAYLHVLSVPQIKQLIAFGVETLSILLQNRETYSELLTYLIDYLPKGELPKGVTNYLGEKTFDLEKIRKWFHLQDNNDEINWKVKNNALEDEPEHLTKFLNILFKAPPYLKRPAAYPQFNFNAEQLYRLEDSELENIPIFRDMKSGNNYVFNYYENLTNSLKKRVSDIEKMPNGSNIEKAAKQKAINDTSHALGRLYAFGERLRWKHTDDDFEKIEDHFLIHKGVELSRTLDDFNKNSPIDDIKESFDQFKADNSTWFTTNVHSHLGKVFRLPIIQTLSPAKYSKCEYFRVTNPGNEEQDLINGNYLSNLNTMIQTSIQEQNFYGANAKNFTVELTKKKRAIRYMPMLFAPNKEEGNAWFMDATKLYFEAPNGLLDALEDELRYTESDKSLRKFVRQRHFVNHAELLTQVNKANTEEPISLLDAFDKYLHFTMTIEPVQLPRFTDDYYQDEKHKLYRLRLDQTFDDRSFKDEMDAMFAILKAFEKIKDEATAVGFKKQKDDQAKSEVTLADLKDFKMVKYNNEFDDLDDFWVILQDDENKEKSLKNLYNSLPPNNVKLPDYGADKPEKQGLEHGTAKGFNIYINNSVYSSAGIAAEYQYFNALVQNDDATEDCCPIWVLKNRFQYIVPESINGFRYDLTTTLDITNSCDNYSGDDPIFPTNYDFFQFDKARFSIIDQSNNEVIKINDMDALIPLSDKDIECSGDKRQPIKKEFDYTLIHKTSEQNKEPELFTEEQRFKLLNQLNNKIGLTCKLEHQYAYKLKNSYETGDPNWFQLKLDKPIEHLGCLVDNGEEASLLDDIPLLIYDFKPANTDDGTLQRIVISLNATYLQSVITQKEIDDNPKSWWKEKLGTLRRIYESIFDLKYGEVQYEVEAWNFDNNHNVLELEKIKADSINEEKMPFIADNFVLQKTYREGSTDAYFKVSDSLFTKLSAELFSANPSFRAFISNIESLVKRDSDDTLIPLVKLVDFKIDSEVVDISKKYNALRLKMTIKRNKDQALTYNENIDTFEALEIVQKSKDDDSPLARINKKVNKHIPDLKNWTNFLNQDKIEDAAEWEYKRTYSNNSDAELYKSSSYIYSSKTDLQERVTGDVTDSYFPELFGDSLAYLNFPDGIKTSDDKGVNLVHEIYPLLFAFEPVSPDPYLKDIESSRQFVAYVAQILKHLAGKAHGKDIDLDDLILFNAKNDEGKWNTKEILEKSGKADEYLSELINKLKSLVNRVDNFDDIDKKYEAYIALKQMLKNHFSTKEENYAKFGFIHGWIEAILTQNINLFESAKGFMLGVFAKYDKDGKTMTPHLSKSLYNLRYTNEIRVLKKDVEDSKALPEATFSPSDTLTFNFENIIKANGSSEQPLRLFLDVLEDEKYDSDFRIREIEIGDKKTQDIAARSAEDVIENQRHYENNDTKEKKRHCRRTIQY